MAVVVHPGGHPVTKRTPAALKRLCEALERGVPFKYAARYAGMSETTAHKSRQQFPEWSTAIEEARARFTVKALSQIQLAAEEPKNWQAAAWMLERLMPAEFGRHEILHEGEPLLTVRYENDWRRSMAHTVVEQAEDVVAALPSPSPTDTTNDGEPEGGD